MRVNGRERLACITPLSHVGGGHKPVRLEPLRNFPLIGDLLVNFRPFMAALNQIALPPIRGVEPGAPDPMRLENCIECGLCLSACPIAGSDPRYLGPAALAAAGRLAREPRGRELQPILEMVEGEHGLWRCHAAFECTQVCPASVDPAGEIMHLRRRTRR